MRIDKITVKPNQNSINSELVFEVDLFIYRPIEIPLEITGYLLTKDERKLANISTLLFESGKKFELAAHDNRGIGEEKCKLIITSQLTDRSVEIIGSNRNNNKKGDVELKLDIYIKTLHSKTTLSCFTKLSEEMPVLSKRQKGEFILYNYDSNFRSSNEDMWVLSGKGGSVFLEQSTFNQKSEIIISSSDWVHDFCPVFNIGNFVVFEFFTPEFVKGSGTMAERLNGAIKALQDMKEEIIKGDWNSVIEKSRGVFELLRNKAEVKDLLEKDGYTAEAISNIDQSFQSLFNLSSKFHHKEDQGKNIMPDIRAAKEDAYLIYSLAAGVVNMVSNKYSRLK
ncbi:MAG: hypothetical protein KKG02_10655 [Candidatus Edwardsbacteria bacterium]|nr:hypothetical protein [Candidatus Edwardsbacteria bacterium]